MPTVSPTFACLAGETSLTFDFTSGLGPISALPPYSFSFGSTPISLFLLPTVGLFNTFGNEYHDLYEFKAGEFGANFPCAAGLGVFDSSIAYPIEYFFYAVAFYVEPLFSATAISPTMVLSSYNTAQPQTVEIYGGFDGIFFSTQLLSVTIPAETCSITINIPAFGSFPYIAVVGDANSQAVISSLTVYCNTSVSRQA